MKQLLLKSLLLIAALTLNIDAFAQIASGTSGTCSWVISNDSVLTISPTDGESGILANNYAASGTSWYSNRTKIKSVIVEKGVATEEQARYLFSKLTNCTKMDLSNLDVSKAINISYMFKSCTSLTSLDVSNWNVSNDTTLYETFYGCSKLEYLDLSTWDVSKVTTLYGTFNNCHALKQIDLANWNTGEVTTMDRTFAYCYSLTSINIENWDVSKVVDLPYAFWNCKSLTSLDLSKWNITLGSRNALCKTFYGCSSLTSLNLSNWKTSKLELLDETFTNCTALTYLNLSGWNIKNIKITQYSTQIVKYKTNLETLVTPETVYSTEYTLPYTMYDWDDDNAEYTTMPGGSITLHKTKGDLSVTIGTSGYATLYYGKYNLKVANGVTAYTYSVNGDEVKQETAYNGGEIIPAGTGVVLYDGDTENVNTYTFYYSCKEGVASENNMLYGSDEDALTVAPDDGDYYFYQLSLNAKGEEGSVGFYWGADDGGAFTNNAHKAYLVVPQSSGVKMYPFGGTTDITSINVDEESGVYYDLQGRRLNGQPTERGIYITNGKKILVM